MKAISVRGFNDIKITKHLAIELYVRQIFNLKTGPNTLWKMEAWD